ncbi:MAG: TIGR03067 domain-containing protein [Planctomycetes bacterium]|nr:TIGR03067 domain-containing protein [Planctomycetota bacterium]
MRHIATLVLFVGLLSLGCKSKPEPARPGDDAKGVQGRWKIVSGEFNGKAAPADKFADIEIVVDGDSITAFEKGVEIKDEEARPKFKIDHSTSPKSVDLMLTSTESSETRDLNDKTIKKETRTRTDIAKGIYELNGDTLKLCIRFPKYDDKGNAIDPERPTTFTPENKTDISIAELKRVK